MNTTLDTLLVIGDRVLIKPKSLDDTTSMGLILPPSVQENEKVRTGYVVKVGPGYPLPMVADADESWKGTNDTVKYIPLQAQIGDLALYLQRDAIEIEWKGNVYYIIHHNSILLLSREEY